MKRTAMILMCLGETPEEALHREVRKELATFDDIDREYLEGIVDLLKN